jgi:nickel transport protein
MLCGLCAAWVLCALPDTARAHRVNLFAWDEDGRVCSRSSYGKNAGIADARLTVRDADGKELLQGRSDRDGNFCFARPGAAELLLVVDAGQGHRGEFRLSAKNPSAPSENGTPPEPPPVAAPPDHEELRRVVREELERVLPPLLERHRERIPPPGAVEEPGLREILGGLGWIAGLAALFAWYRGRRAS